MKRIDNAKQTPSQTPPCAAWVGLDWGDETHALSLRARGSQKIERTSLDQTPEALSQWINALRTRFPDGQIAICLEQSRGALVAALAGCEHVVLYPLNPKSLARFREAFYPSRSKNDPVDADLLLELLCSHLDRLRPWKPDTAQTRQLALLNEHRRGFVDERTALASQLQAHLKMIFPQALELAGPDLSSQLATDFLKKWPTRPDLQKVKPATLRKFYYGHNCRSEKLMTHRLERARNAQPLTRDGALIEAHRLAIQTLAAQLAALRPSLEAYDRQIAALFSAHPDSPLFSSLPGAGAALAPRLLTSLGTDRSRFEDGCSVSCYPGIAPVSEKSGKTQHWVHVRWSCPKFIRQSWHEFANASRRFCPWADACYQDLIQRSAHHEAIRKLAYKWQRIVWRMWKDHQPYDDRRYVESLQKRGLKRYEQLVLPPVETVNKK